jgi:hypothetical protein
VRPNSASGERRLGSFQELRPEQQQLVIEIINRFNISTAQSLTGHHAYDEARVSGRSTFEAITQALGQTKLTSTSGKPHGNSLEIVHVIEDVAGGLPGTRGDQQFRVYAVMKPGAIEKLQQSQEFFRP